MTDQTAELRALALAATTSAPGRWRYVPWHIAEGPSQVRTATYLLCETPSDKTAAYIAAANPAAVLALLDAYEGALARIATLETESASEQPKHWTCFHCGEDFTDWREAGKHFGYRIDEQPAACRDALAAAREALRIIAEQPSIMKPGAMQIGQTWQSTARNMAEMARAEIERLDRAQARAEEEGRDG